MENVTNTNQMPSNHASDTLPNTAGLSVTDGVPNTSTTSNMPSGTTGSANVQVTDQTGQTGGQTDASAQSNIDTAKHATLDNDNGNGNANGNKEQLRRRVMQRETDLSKALEGLEGNEERRNALQGALDAGRDVLKTGWEHISEVEAAHLSRWLETSDTLVAQGIPADAGSQSATDATKSSGKSDEEKPAVTAADQPAVQA